MIHITVTSHIIQPALLVPSLLARAQHGIGECEQNSHLLNSDAYDILDTCGYIPARTLRFTWFLFSESSVDGRNPFLSGFRLGNIT